MNQIVVRKRGFFMLFRVSRPLFRTICTFLALFLVCGVFTLFSQKINSEVVLSAIDTSTAPPPLTVVIDAGHGGEDGGASSADGIVEKELNLKIAELLCDMLKSNGVKVVMTRTEDVLLYDKNADYIGRKKALDLAERRKIAEETENCIFVSIHMNAFPMTQYSGLQVWYSPNNPASQSLAESIRKTVCETLQPDNERQSKRATSSIYLLHHLNAPAVLIECGFLSNPQECAKLSQEDYQKKLAFSIYLSIVNYLNDTSKNPR